MASSAKISSVAGTAFVDISGIDLTAYHGTDAGFTPYFLTLTDSGGKTATGYIGAMGVGETLGSQLHTSANAASDPNGNEANATTGWGTGGLITFTSDAVVYSNGSWSLKGVATGANGRFNYLISGGNGKLMKLTFKDRHLGAGGDWRCGIASGDGITAERYLHDLVNTDTTFTERTIYINRQTGTGSLDTDYIYVYENNAGNDGGAYLDNFSVKQVTDCAVTGAHIVSAKNGTTRDWTNIQAGFDLNDQTGYTVAFTLDMSGYTWYPLWRSVMNYCKTIHKRRKNK